MALTSRSLTLPPPGSSTASDSSIESGAPLRPKTMYEKRSPFWKSCVVSSTCVVVPLSVMLMGCVPVVAVR